VKRTRVVLVAALAVACGEDEAAGPKGPIVFEGLSIPGDVGMVTDMAFVPGSESLLVLEKSGRIREMRLDGDALELVGEVQLDVHDESDCGLISIAFDPDFATNHFAYVGYCVDAQSSGIFRLTLDGALESATASLTEILVLGDARAQRSWHAVGALGFDDEGMLWAAFGDKTVRAHGQDHGTALGGIVRIVPNREATGSGYEPAPGNPFLADPNAAPELYATGLRSPWRALRDSKGHLFIGDVGADDYEELNVLTDPGQNFGWATFEGPCTEDCEGLTDPLVGYDHEADHPFIEDDPEAAPGGLRVVYVGAEYLPTSRDRYDGRLTGKVIYGDLCVGFIRAVETDAAGGLVSDEHVAHLRFAGAWAQGPDDYLYVATMGACTTDRDPGPPAFHRMVLSD
jgi:glucose/arabinose dehydrogenase